MKSTTILGLLALGLARNAIADSWPAPALSSSSSTPCAATNSTMHLSRVIPTSTVTSTITETVFKETTIVERSTVFIEPGLCAPTTVTVDGNGLPFPPPAPTPVAPVDVSRSWAPAPAPGTATTASGVKISITAVDPATPSDDSWLESTNDVSTIGMDGDVFTWTGDNPAATETMPAPMYTDWPGDGSWPTPGSPSSNVTAPQEGNSGGSCNTAADRSKWCDGKSTSTDYYAAEYSTGQICLYEFTITNTTIDFDGSGAKMAFAINGQIPGPLIECNWGDVLQVTVHNKLQNNSTAIHWHGTYSLYGTTK